MDLEAKRVLGPNVKRLAIEFASYVIIPPGSGSNPMELALSALTDGAQLSAAMQAGLARVDQAVALVKAAPDNPYGDDEEAIAGEILRRLDARRETEKHQRRAQA